MNILPFLLAAVFFFSSLPVHAEEAVDTLVITSDIVDPIERARDVRDRLEEVLETGKVNTTKISIKFDDTVGVLERVIITCKAGTGEGNGARMIIIFSDDKDIEERLKRTEDLERSPYVKKFEIQALRVEGRDDAPVIVVMYVLAQEVAT